MISEFTKIQELLKKKSEIETRLNLLAYDGTPEIKIIDNKKFLYVRKRVASKLKSTYVGVYSDELYNLLLQNNKESKFLRKELRHIIKELANLGYSNEVTPRVIQNIDFARANMKSNIYDQAILEGVGTTYPQTEEIIENGKVSGVKAEDVLKILNLKHAWQFILNIDVLTSKTDYYLLSSIAKIVNEGMYYDGGRIRGVPVSILGTSYIPPIPREDEVKEKIKEIISREDEIINKAIKLCLYLMKTQIFIDGNKRASVIFANHYLIKNGEGLLVIPFNKVDEFKKLLISYYEDKDNKEIIEFMKKECWNKF